MNHYQETQPLKTMHSTSAQEDSQFVVKSKEARQDWQAIGQFMARSGFALDEAKPPQQFMSGLANLNYLLHLKNGKKVVLRRPPNGDAPPGAYDLSREFHIYHQLGQHLPFVPKGLILCEDLTVIGAPFFVMEFCDGVALHKHNIPAQLSIQPEIGNKLSKLVIESLTKLHKLNPASVGLADLGNPEGFITRQIHGWKKRGDRILNKEQSELMQTLYEWLLDHQPENEPVALVHHDYKLDNIIVQSDTLEISGVIDWEMATVGNPLFDLALTLAVWGEEPDDNVYSRLSMMPCHLNGWWSRKKALQTYSELTGINISPESWKFYWLLALLRMGVVFGQLAHLYETQSYMNEKTNPDFHLLPEDFSPLATDALRHGVALINDQPLDF